MEYIGITCYTYQYCYICKLAYHKQTQDHGRVIGPATQTNAEARFRSDSTGLTNNFDVQVVGSLDDYGGGGGYYYDYYYGDPFA